MSTDTTWQKAAVSINKLEQNSWIRVTIPKINNVLIQAQSSIQQQECIYCHKHKTILFQAAILVG